MGTYRVVSIVKDGRNEWAVEWTAPGYPPHQIRGPFKTADEAQAVADSLAAMEKGERQ
jgi:hypothetical protein